jgi:general secretion pathway protein G
MIKKSASSSGQLVEDKGSQEANPLVPTAHNSLHASARGFTLLELVITLIILTILTMGAIPLIKVSVKRQREQRLREALREMRTAIDTFHREAVAGGQTNPATASTSSVQPAAALVDPRIRVAITDNTIFGTSNPDRYPPDLETMVNGVSVTPIQSNTRVGGPQGPDATSNTLTSTKKKVYLRGIPIDPMTGERDWCLKSVYDSADAPCSSNPENVFDVRSSSDGTALDGSKYSDW